MTTLTRRQIISPNPPPKSSKEFKPDYPTVLWTHIRVGVSSFLEREGPEGYRKFDTYQKQITLYFDTLPNFVKQLRFRGKMTEKSAVDAWIMMMFRGFC